MHLGRKPQPILAIACSLVAALLTSAAIEDDPYEWMEEVESEKALAWAKEISEKTTTEFEAVPEFEGIHAKFVEIYNSKDRIPGPTYSGGTLYNFWQDPDHVRGIWRRTSVESYLEDEPDWEIVLDVDALAAAEGENWVWKGVTFLPPEDRFAMIRLSRGGADATVQREFDTQGKRFVDNGFYLPEAKSRVSWLDENTLYVGTDFGDDTLTDSGYPRISKRWSRGQTLSEATTIFEGRSEDVSAGTYVSHRPENRYEIVSVSPEFFRNTSYLKLGERLVKLDLPDDAELKFIFKEKLLIYLRSDWAIDGSTYPGDALLAIGLDDFLQGNRDFEILFSPEERVAFNSLADTRDHLIYSTLDNVSSRLYRLRQSNGLWLKEEIDLPGLGTVALASSSPAWFDPTGMRVVQNEATSKDGTKIPYFLVMPRGFEADGNNPTLLYAYGGFEISQKPSYSSSVGSAWLERGGVYVLANIRGGGEFGPKWHTAAIKEKRQTNFDDLIAVAEDLIARKITSPEHLGIQGGSQGGLLVSGAFTQRPDLFKAVVSAVPLADMKRYNKLLAGASWMAEYGNPDTEDWEYMKLWSPYQNLSPDKEYPEVYYWTNTRDDRVHPAHARKMVARLQEFGNPVYYYENTEGGHGGGTNPNQRAYTSALSYAYLWKMLR